MKQKSNAQVVIFEGVDNTGKSNIAREFCKRHQDFDYFKTKSEKFYVTKMLPKEVALVNFMNMSFMLDFIKQVKFNAVFDRFYPSEYVYGSLFRKLNSNSVLAFDKLFAKLDVKIIILTKKDSELSDRFFNKKQLIEIKNKYAEFVKKTRCKCIVMDTTDRNLEKQIKTIEEFVYDKNS